MVPFMSRHQPGPFSPNALNHEGAQAPGVLKHLRAVAAFPLSQGGLLPSLSLLAGPAPHRLNLSILRKVCATAGAGAADERCGARAR